MGKNRNRNRRQNRVNKIGAKDIMKKILAYKDSETILEAVSNRQIISSAAENFVSNEEDVDAVVKMVGEFLITLDSEETFAVLSVLDKVVYNLGDLPANVEDIPEMVYQDFSNMIGNGQTPECVKSYETLASVIEIIESDLEDMGLTLSDDGVMTMALVEMIFTATDTILNQVWDDCQMAASSSNIPDRETIEQVEPPKSEPEPEIEKVSDEDVEVVTEKDTTSTEPQTEPEEPKTEKLNNDSKTSDGDEDIDVLGILGITEKELFNMSVDDIMGLPGIKTLIDKKLIGMNGSDPYISGTTKNLMVEFVTSAIRDLVCVLKCEDPTKQIEETRNDNNHIASESVHDAETKHDLAGRLVNALNSRASHITEHNKRTDKPNNDDFEIIVTDIDKDVIEYVRKFDVFNGYSVNLIRQEIMMATRKYLLDGRNFKNLSDDYVSARPTLVNSIGRTVVNRLMKRKVNDSRSSDNDVDRTNVRDRMVRTHNDRRNRGVDSFVKCGVGFLPSFN